MFEIQNISKTQNIQNDVYKEALIDFIGMTESVCDD